MEIGNLDDRPTTGLYEIYHLSRSVAGFASNLMLCEKDFLDELEDEEVVVIFEESRAIGFVALYEPQSFIHHFYIHPEYQGKGYGKALLDFIVNSFDSPLALRCEPWNTAALSFYQGRGWEELNRGMDSGGMAYIQLIYGLN